MTEIRRIERKDDAAIERIIRDCLIEYGANHAGCAWEDDLSHFSDTYAQLGSAYWVAEADGAVVAGVGIGGASEHPVYGRVCELQKMYCLPSCRGSGVSQRLLETALAFAAEHSDCVYLETFGNMTAAQRFYARNGFRRIDESLLCTGHDTCDVKMALSPLLFLTTERVGLSHWKPGDGELAASLWGDPRVTRYICAGGVYSPAEVQNRLRSEIDSQARDGVQYWPVFHRQTGDLIGCCGLHPHGAGCYELGFHMRPEYWRQGYATEAANAVIHYAFGMLHAESLFAGHNPNNAASRAVLEKLGFKYTGDEFYPPTGLKHPSYIFRNGR